MTQEEIDDLVRELAYAVDQALDDMGRDGVSIAMYTKARLRIAFEPFRNSDMAEPLMTLIKAELILNGVDAAR